MIGRLKDSATTTTLELTLSPEAPRPGDTLRVEALLPDRPELRVSAVHFRLRCREQRVLGLTGGRPRSTSTTHFDVGVPPLELAPGQLRAAARFTLPAGVPPSHRTTCSSVTYQLDIRLCAPGQADRSEHVQLEVRAPRLEPGPAPRAASTAPGGPQGDELVLEAALESADLAPGGVLSGALTVENVSRHRVRRLELALVCIDSPVGRSRQGPVRQRPLTVVVHPGQPPEGQRLPFRVRLPPDLPPTTTGRRARLEWQLELRAVNRLETDTLLVLPVRVGGPAQPEGAPARATAAPPLGHERRARAWAQVARATGLALDAEAEVLRGAEGQVAYQVELELRGRVLFAVARLRWPSAGLGLEVAERRWLERLGRRAGPLDDLTFERRFRVRAREAAQAQALLAQEARTALLSFAQAALDDDGAELAAPNNGYTVKLLESFTRRAQQVAAVLDRALDELPPPQGLAAHAGAWQALAKRLGGHFAPGGFSLRGARYLGQPVELLTRFGEGGMPEATLARVLLPAPLPGAARPGEAPAWLGAAAARVLHSLGEECEGVCAGPDAVEARLPAPLADPAQAESLWRALSRLAKVLGPAS